MELLESVRVLLSMGATLFFMSRTEEGFLIILVVVSIIIILLIGYVILKEINKRL